MVRKIMKIGGQGLSLRPAGLRPLIIAALFLLCSLLIVSVPFAAQIIIAWDPNTDPNVSGYKIYYGTASGNYGAPLDVGKVTNYAVNGLASNQTYYFAVTAYDSSKNESGFSNEVSGRSGEYGQIIWRNTSTGQNIAWYMKGVNWTGGWAQLSTVGDRNWAVVAVADFTGDGNMDLLWRNASTGRTTIWYMNDQWTSEYSDILPVVDDPNWTIAGAADFNSDGKPDLLWRNASTDRTTVWYMNGVVWTGQSADIPSVGDPSWTITGVGDFNGDGKPDILWRNTSTGRMLVGYMNGATWTGEWNDLLPVVSDPNWKVALIRDFNGDGKPDLLWRNGSTGQAIVWYMDGTIWAGASAELLPNISDPNWIIVRH